MAFENKTSVGKCGIEIQGDNKCITLIQNAQVSAVNRKKNLDQVS